MVERVAPAMFVELCASLQSPLQCPSACRVWRHAASRANESAKEFMACLCLCAVGSALPEARSSLTRRFSGFLKLRPPEATTVHVISHFHATPSSDDETTFEFARRLLEATYPNGAPVPEYRATAIALFQKLKSLAREAKNIDGRS